MTYKIAIVCSTGGHLAQMVRLEPWWSLHERFWVTFDKPDAADRLAGERVFHAHHPTTRNLPNLARNTRMAARLLRTERPDLIVSNGAGLALPFFWLGRAMGVPTMFVEVYDRIDTASLTGRLVSPVASKVVLQWPEQLAHYPEGVVLGRLA